MVNKPYLAIDIGAGSGRAILGYVDDGRMKLKEIHRFDVKPILLGGTLYWDFLFIWDNILESLRYCVTIGAKSLAGIGIDTFNCDFGLLDQSGALLGNPISYRDPGPTAVEEYIKQTKDEKSLFKETGCGFNAITGLSRLVHLKRESTSLILDTAEMYLPMADLFRYFLTGIKQGEETILWGSQLLDIRTRSWNQKLMHLFQLPTKIFPPVISPGTNVGELLPEIKSYADIESAPVIAVAGHDTVSALVSMFDMQEDTAFVFTGTWFVLGVLLKEPETSSIAFHKGFVNEIAVNSTLFARNMMGFYILENLIKTWKLRSIDCSYEILIQNASEQPEFSLHLDVNDPVFFSSVNMNETLSKYLRKRGQEFSVEPGKIVRSIFESLAFSCASAVSDLKEITGRRINRLVMLGGGAKNALLCQMIAGAANIDIITGPSEATAVGNIGMQLLATGVLDSFDDLNELVRKSFSGAEYTPVNHGRLT